MYQKGRKSGSLRKLEGGWKPKGRSQLVTRTCLQWEPMCESLILVFPFVLQEQSRSAILLFADIWLAAA